MSLSQSFQQKLLQKLSPQQIQLMKLLQVPTANLEERIQSEGCSLHPVESLCFSPWQR